MQAFLIALQFLTRFPVRCKGEYSDKQVALSVLYYPLIGAIIGCVLSGIACVMSGTYSMLAAVMVLTAWVLITGGLHLDGLADSADAWAGGYGDKQRSLDIMKDPAAGPLAVVVLIISLLIKFVSIVALIESEFLLGLVLAPIMGRLSVIVLFLTTPYVRQQGLGSSMAQELNQSYAYGVLLITIVPGLLFLPLSIMLLVISTGVIALAFLRYLMIKRLGGMTGDTIGASLEIIELSTLFVIAVAAA